MELTRAEIDAMLRRADEARTKLRRASREMKELGERVMSERDAARASTVAERSSDVDRSR